MTICEGLRVVELGQGMAGPMAGMLLADHGAEVIKVEPPGGDWARSRPGFAMWNRGKRSLALDLGDESDRGELLDLLGRADVVITSWRPDVGIRTGITHDAVAEANPGVVWAEITGFGPIDELRDLQAYEGIVAAKLGKMAGLDMLSGAAVGHPADQPLFTAAPVSSFASANLVVQGVLAALLERSSSGLGQRVTTSLVHGASVGTMRFAFSRDRDEEAQRAHELQLAGLMMTFTNAQCADGKWIQMCARQDHHFRNWLAVMGLAHVYDDPRYKDIPLRFASYDDIAELDGLIRERMRQRTQAEWMRIFIEDVDVGADPFLTPAEFMAHPDMLANGRIVEVDDPAVGPTTQPGPLVQLAATPPVLRGPAPRLDDARGAIDWPRSSTPTTTDVTPTGRGPLDGITILEVAHYLAGPLGSTLLAELGARVIKVEPIEGDSYRRVGLEFVQLAHGKESIALDLKSAEGRALLLQLVDRSDALLHNFRLGVPERLGFGAEQVFERNPRLVYLYAGSYGSKGPQSKRAAMHSTPNALCGGGIIQAGEGNAPVDDSWPDPCAGIGVATGLMLGLYARERTGSGQYVETTMLTSAAHVFSDELVQHVGRPAPAVSDHEQRGPGPLYRLYPCQEGWIFLAVVQEHEWTALVDVLGAPSWAEDGRGSSDLADHLEATFATDGAGAWETRLRQRGVPAVEVVAGVNFEEALVRLGFMEEAEHPAFGRYWKHPPTTELSRSTTEVRAACGLGEHTVALLRELGHTDESIDALAAAGVVRIGA